MVSFFVEIVNLLVKQTSIENIINICYTEYNIQSHGVIKSDFTENIWSSSAGANSEKEV